jgi:SNF2 family DNA or RNA helicase
MGLRPYQEVAADFLFERDRAMILAPVGAGKTAITLTAMQDMTERRLVRRWLVLAPKRVAQSVWPVEQPKWAPKLTMSVAVGTPKQRRAAFKADTQVVVTNFENVESIEGTFDGVVFDELTRLKNPSGVRFKKLEKLIEGVEIRWGLTGSFTSNGLEDVFGQCKIVDRALLGRSKGAFMQQYFCCIHREFGMWEPLPGALERVMETIKPATFVLEPGEYKDRLPELHTVEMRCSMDLTAYNQMKKDFVLELGETITAPTAASVTTKLQQLAGGWVYGPSGAEWLSTHKYDLLDEILEENQHDNTIVVYNYKEELAELQRRYPKAETLDAPDAINRWNNKEIELLLIHPKSAQFGLNLQFGGNKMIFLSMPWSLVDFEQAMGRIHRSGQPQDVWVYLLITEKTIDEKILAALQRKKTVAEIALEALA